MGGWNCRERKNFPKLPKMSKIRAPVIEIPVLLSRIPQEISKPQMVAQ